MLGFFQNMRAVGCVSVADGDMLLYEWGTFDWGQGEWFQLGITRQFIEGVGDDGGEDDHFWRLSLTFYFQPSPAFRALGRGNRWCASHDAVEELRTFVTSTTAYATAIVTPIARVELNYGNAG